MSLRTRAPLGELTRVVGGTTPSTSEPANFGGEVVWVTPADLGLARNSSIASSVRKITEEARRRAGIELLPVGTVVMSSRAPIGYLGIAAVPLCTNQGCKSFVPGPQVDSHFLFHMLRYQMPAIRSLGAGATFSEVSKTQLEQFEIPVPPIDVQRKLGEELDASLRSARSAEAAVIALEARVRELQGRAYAAAFQASKQTRVRLGDVVALVRGVSFNGDEASNAEGQALLPVLRAGNIRDGLELESDLIWVPDFRVSEEQRMRPGDIAICMSSGSPRVVGKTALLDAPFRGSVGAFCAILRPSSVVRPRYLAAWLRSPGFWGWRDGQTRGANIQNLRLSALADLSLDIPDVATQDEVVRRLDFALEKIDSVARSAKVQREAIEALPAALLRRAFEGLAA